MEKNQSTFGEAVGKSRLPLFIDSQCIQRPLNGRHCKQMAHAGSTTTRMQSGHT